MNSFGPAPTLADMSLSTQVVDRNNKLLRAYATPDGRWRLPVTASDVDPRFVEMLLAYEDRRFRTHRGVDPLAMARAAWQWAGNAHVVSGGSTLTMQVARLLEPRAERTIRAKLHQIVRAIELERKLSKAEILSLYLTLAPYGGNLEGVRAASLAYFGKEPKKLTLAEAALLVALPQSPGLRRPDRSADMARKARDRVLDRIAAGGKLPPDEIAYAKRDAVPNARRPMPALAPHAADQAIAAAPAQKRAPADHRRARFRKISRTSPASAPARSASACRSPSSWSTTPPAKCWPASPRPIISTSAAPARST